MSLVAATSNSGRTLELRVPRVRSGSFSTDLFARYQRSDQALILAMMEMVINGVSTRKVRNHGRVVPQSVLKRVRGHMVWVLRQA